MSANPFSARFIRPGAISFVFSAGESAETIVERLRGQNWRGEILGDHGSGKSTLLETLIPVLEAGGKHVERISLHQGERRLPPIDRARLGVESLLLIDGYEQLSWWSRRRVKSLCQRCGAGLLVTAHSDMGLPTVYQTQASVELAQRVVAKLFGSDEVTVSQDDIAKAYSTTGGNMRETLFQLYDVYQAEKSTARSTGQ